MRQRLSPTSETANSTGRNFSITSMFVRVCSVGSVVTKWPSLADAAMPSGVVWVAWPKNADDLTESTVRSSVRSSQRHADWVGGQVVNVGDRWLALRYVMPADTRPVWRRS